ncbi:hypothetical protein [Pseudolabrys taiwanensis]|uniref:hypothetical protein n=1 Tax=Pseudolabrys taiwanensis TaxID=331696 RepID=UPI0013B44B23|nr:hypothetical protein [Pseudolabrys taiwanensis]
MTTSAPPRLPPAPFTRYPRRCFPLLPRRRQEAAHDRLLQHIVAKLTPAARPRLRLRRRPGDARPQRLKRQRLSLRAAARRWSDLLAVWRHCDDGRCRDLRRCEGDALSCLPHHVPQLPQPAQFWFACVGIAAEKNMSFAEAVTVAERDTEQACARWHATLGVVLRTHGTPPRRAHKE